MIRQSVRSLALAAAGLLLSGVAWAQPPTLVQVSSETQFVASEYFGGEARVVSVSKMDLDSDAADAQRPFVGLAATAVSKGNVAEITFKLSGATFDQAATPTNLDLRNPGTAACRGAASPNIKVSVARDGARGDSSVTFRAEATENFTSGQYICFWVPDLSVTLASSGTAPNVVRFVEVTSSTKPTANTGTPFPNGPARGSMAVPDKDGGPATYPIQPGSKRILQASNALRGMLSAAGSGQVNIKDRTKIAVGGKPDPSATGSGAKTNGLVLGKLSVNLAAGPIWKLDGSGPLSSQTLDSSLSGQVKLSVGGRFQSGDMVVYGSGATAFKAKISGNMAELSVPLEVGSTNAKEIVYVPGGVDVLKPATFTTGAAYLFNDRRNNNAMIRPIMARINYLGVGVKGYVYGVVRGGGVESSIARVTCVSSSTSSCAIFADCTDQEGMDYFGAAPAIPVGATAVWNSDALAGVLGGGWDSGRGRCEILSDSSGELAVQHMVRTGSGLINNSTVVGRGLNEAEEGQTRSDFRATWAVLDNICRSVGSNDDDQDSNAAGAQLTECGPKAPWRTAAP